MIPPKVMASDYMAFAKRDAEARYTLASSGVASAEMADLGFDMAGLQLHGPNAYGYVPLMERIAARFAIDPASVVTAAGCAMANWLAMGALVQPGDEVLVEAPTYELLTASLSFLQADLKTFPRRADGAWRLDPETVAAAITPRTRLVVVTNLHNPTSALATPAEIAAIAAACARVGATLLVDEVYLELMFADGPAFTSFTTAPNIVVTSSLTKAYGVTGLRCGWVLAQPDLAERMRRLNDLFYATDSFVSEQLSVAAFDALPHLRARATTILDTNRAAYREILGAHPDLDQALFEQGTTVFPRLGSGDGDGFFNRLKLEHETTVVPGRFFGCPDHIRIGLGGDPAMTRTGLQRIADALG